MTTPIPSGHICRSLISTCVSLRSSRPQRSLRLLQRLVSDSLGEGPTLFRLTVRRRAPKASRSRDYMKVKVRTVAALFWIFVLYAIAFGYLETPPDARPLSEISSTYRSDLRPSALPSRG